MARRPTRFIPASVFGSVGILLASLAYVDRPGGPPLAVESAGRTPQADVGDAQVASVDVATAIAREIDNAEPMPGAAAQERRTLVQLYQSEGYAPFWIDGAGQPNRSAREALTLLRNADGEGLTPSDYRSATLDGLASTLTRAPSAHDVARFDTELTAGTLRYLRHLHLGRVDPRTIGFQMSVPVAEHDFGALLRSAHADDRVAELAASVAPPLVQYRSLREALARYRALAADMSLEPLPSVADAIHPGEPYAGLSTLGRRLSALGDLPSDAPVPTADAPYEGPLVEGVKRFQLRHGLAPDGVLGKATLAALDTPLAWRVRQIELALERLRWLPDLGARRLLVVNIPMFRLWAWDSIPPSGAPLFGMGVIVGRALDTQTPVFVSEMRHVIFRPYWNVPASILRDEIVPALERDPDYLSRQNMEIMRGSSGEAQPVPATAENRALLEEGRLWVRQRPGPRNALGLVKFVFPNDEDVYMHGTPAQGLFSRARRDFSHGCVRVEVPAALAEWVLKDQSEWTRDRILAAMSGTESREVALLRPIQVILFYTTAAVMPEDGTVRFAEDIYGHDTTLDRALAGGPTGQ